MIQLGGGFEFVEVSPKMGQMRVEIELVQKVTFPNLDRMLCDLEHPVLVLRLRRWRQALHALQNACVVCELPRRNGLIRNIHCYRSNSPTYDSTCRRISPFRMFLEMISISAAIERSTSSFAECLRTNSAAA